MSASLTEDGVTLDDRAVTYTTSVSATSNGSGAVNFDFGTIYDGDDSIMHVQASILGTGTFEVSYIQANCAKVSGQGLNNTFNTVSSYSAEGLSMTPTAYDYLGSGNQHGFRIACTGADASSTYSCRNVVSRIGESST